VLPRADGGLLISGSASLLPAPPGWWTVALDAEGGEVWRHFSQGAFAAGVFSGAFLLSSDPVRLWANDETECGVFSLLLWSIDAITGDPLWTATWPPQDSPVPCRSMTPHSVVLAGDRVIAGGKSNVHPLDSEKSVALSFDAVTGASLWARAFDDSTASVVQGQAAATEDKVLLATSLFHQPGEDAPLKLSTWYSDGTTCVEATPLQTARVIAVLPTADAGVILVGSRFSASTANDLIVQRTDVPCQWRFADGFESESAAAAAN
jgi:hypothetical protein